MYKNLGKYVFHVFSEKVQVFLFMELLDNTHRLTLSIELYVFLSCFSILQRCPNEKKTSYIYGETPIWKLSKNVKNEFKSNISNKNVFLLSCMFHIDGENVLKQPILNNMFFFNVWACFLDSKFSSSNAKFPGMSNKKK